MEIKDSVLLSMARQPGWAGSGPLSVEMNTSGAESTFLSSQETRQPGLQVF